MTILWPSPYKDFPESLLLALNIIRENLAIVNFTQKLKFARSNSGDNFKSRTYNEIAPPHLLQGNFSIRISSKAGFY